MNWDDVAEIVRQWEGQFCLKGIMSVADAKRAVEIGCTGIVVSNHGGRQLDGSRASFDQLAEIVDAVGDRIDVLMDGGVQRGSHVLKALSVGAKAVGVGRYYLYPLAAAGQIGVEWALGLMKAELERDMKLMGCTSINQLSREISGSDERHAIHRVLDTPILHCVYEGQALEAPSMGWTQMRKLPASIITFGLQCGSRS